MRDENTKVMFTVLPFGLSIYQGLLTFEVSDAKDVTSSGHILGKDIFARRMFTNVERTGSRKGSFTDFLVLVKTLGETIFFAASIVSDNNLQFFVMSFTLKAE